jgi:putative oxidoreductase
MNLGLFVIRFVIGGLLVGHGTQKLLGWFGGHGPQGTGAFFESLGLRPGTAMAVGAGLGEVVGGVLIALGLLTPVGAALLIAVMLTAIWTVHRGSGLWVSDGGPEYNLVILAALFAVTAIGPGAWSLDHALGIDAAGAGWAFAALAAGVIGAIATVAFGRASFRRESGSPVPPAAFGAPGTGESRGPDDRMRASAPATVAIGLVRFSARGVRRGEARYILERQLSLIQPQSKTGASH